MHCRQSAATCFVCRELYHVSKHITFLSYHLATCTAGKVHTSIVLWLVISQSVHDTARETFSTAQSQSSASLSVRVLAFRPAQTLPGDMALHAS